MNSLQTTATLGLCLSLTGCHVVERAQQCGHLAAALRGAQKELSVQLGDNPSTQDLNQRAATFKELARTLNQLPTKAPAVESARVELVGQMKFIGSHLEKAAIAVSRRPAEILREQEAAANESKHQERTPTQEESLGEKESVTLPKLAPSRPGNQLVNKDVTAPASDPVAPKKPAISLRKTYRTSSDREYDRARRLIQTTSAALKSTLRRLRGACNSNN